MLINEEYADDNWSTELAALFDNIVIPPARISKLL
jgi:hypothetical protein